MYQQDMKFLWTMLSLGQLYTDANADDDNDDNTDNDDINDNDTWWTNHDCIGSLACMPNESKRTINRQHVCMLDVNKFSKLKNMGWFQEYALFIYPLRDMSSPSKLHISDYKFAITSLVPNTINFTAIRTIQ